MKKVILRLDCGVGMHSADAYLVSEEDWVAYSEGKDINDPLSIYAWESAVEFASGYGIYPDSDRQDDYDDDAENTYDEYSDAIEGWFEEYDSDEHDGLMIGGQTEWDWREI